MLFVEVEVLFRLHGVEVSGEGCVVSWLFDGCSLLRFASLNGKMKDHMKKFDGHNICCLFQGFDLQFQTVAFNLHCGMLCFCCSVAGFGKDIFPFWRDLIVNTLCCAG